MTADIAAELRDWVSALDANPPTHRLDIDIFLDEVPGILTAAAAEIDQLRRNEAHDRETIRVLASQLDEADGTGRGVTAWVTDAATEALRTPREGRP